MKRGLIGLVGGLILSAIINHDVGLAAVAAAILYHAESKR